MSLELPADAEPFIPEGGDLSDLHNPGVYCLTLTRPDTLASAWDDTFDTRPAYWEHFASSERVAYVGASGDILTRLEEHRDGETRKAALLEVCEIDALRNIWWTETETKAFEEESNLAIMLQNAKPSWYVHQR